MKPIRRTPAYFVVLVLCALGLGSCSKQVTSQAAPAASAAPMSALDREIADYDKTAKEYLHVVKQKKTGDVSVTMRYIDLRGQMHAAATKLGAQAGQMNPAQQKRVALIGSRTAPFLRE